MLATQSLPLSAVTARPDPGTRVYAVGDVHGRSDLLDRLLRRIREDAAESPASRTVLLMLGDYVDRGPDSRGVIDRLTGPAPPGFDRVCLKGNHEDFMVRFLDDVSIGPSWLYNGGGETLESYGLDAPASLSGGRRRVFGDAAGWQALLLAPEPDQLRLFADLQAALRAHLPSAHEQFLRGLPHFWECGGFFFAHAGVNPDRRLHEQSPADLMWIRNRFLFADDDFGRVVVHGHTPRPEPEVRANRIGVDTGAFSTDRLTCVRLSEQGATFIST